MLIIKQLSIQLINSSSRVSFLFSLYSCFLASVVRSHSFKSHLSASVPFSLLSRLRSIHCHLSTHSDHLRRFVFPTRSYEKTAFESSFQPVIMPVPSYGAMPLSKMFLFTRILQVVSMIVIIGISANFISMIVSTGVEAPQEFVGALSVVSCYYDLLQATALTTLRPALRPFTLLSALASTGQRLTLVFSS